jgi:uroporphyrinogen-III synthase
MSPLHGIGVLVTRPEQQAMTLCRLLEAQGAATVRLPAIEIKPCGDLGALQAQVAAFEAFDLIVFTSANAVRFGSALLEQRHDLNLAAIGPATARALQQSGYRVAVQPAAGFDSEALLKSARLEHISGHRILLIKGSDGRQLLEQELRRRGAHVVSADVYERTPANPAAAELAAVQSEIDAGRLHVITATSEEIGSCLLGMLPRAGLHKLRWLVPGARVAAALRGRGLLAPLVIAASAEDQELVAALVRWRSEEPAA